MQVPPRARWKTAVVSGTDPAVFAKAFETQMNELVSEGWHIHGMMERAGALIITAIRPDVPDDVMAALREAGMMAGKPPGQGPRPARKDPNTVEEVVYNYKELGTTHSIACTLKEAVGYFEEHAARWKGIDAGPGPDILPISIVVMQVTSYELADIPVLKQRVMEA